MKGVKHLFGNSRLTTKTTVSFMVGDTQHVGIIRSCNYSKDEYKVSYHSARKEDDIIILNRCQLAAINPEDALEERDVHTDVQYGADVVFKEIGDLLQPVDVAYPFEVEDFIPNGEL